LQDAGGAAGRAPEAERPVLGGGDEALAVRGEAGAEDEAGVLVGAAAGREAGGGGGTEHAGVLAGGAGARGGGERRRGPRRRQPELGDGAAAARVPLPDPLVGPGGDEPLAVGAGGDREHAAGVGLDDGGRRAGEIPEAERAVVAARYDGGAAEGSERVDRAG